jgi:hypothetical protein
MILRELFYFNRDTGDTETNDRYNPSNDSDVLEKDDTRKTRLTLSQINELRKTSEQHILETEKELEFISRMYAAPPAAE